MKINFHGGDSDSGNVFAVETFAPAGMMLESHVHPHSHLSVLVRGKAKVTVAGVPTVFDGYNIVMVPANTMHSVEALTDIVWLCLWAGDLAPKELAYESLKLVAAHGVN